jgi:hypothetical protein
MNHATDPQYDAADWIAGDMAAAEDTVRRLGRRAAARYEADLADQNCPGCRQFTTSQMIRVYAGIGWRKRRASR